MDRVTRDLIRLELDRVARLEVNLSGLNINVSNHTTPQEGKARLHGPARPTALPHLRARIEDVAPAVLRAVSRRSGRTDSRNERELWFEPNYDTWADDWSPRIARHFDTLWLVSDLLRVDRPSPMRYRVGITESYE